MARRRRTHWDGSYLRMFEFVSTAGLSCGHGFSFTDGDRPKPILGTMVRCHVGKCNGVPRYVTWLPATERGRHRRFTDDLALKTRRAVG